MKTLLIDASPKKHLSNSAYFMGFGRLFMCGRGNRFSKAKLPRTALYDDLFNRIGESDRVVLATPLYVDGVPSHVLRFLTALERRCAETGVSIDLYVLANCGFYEGRQTRCLMEQMEAWCERAKVKFRGGLGIGAGEMLGFLRVLPAIYLLIAIVMAAISLIGQLAAGSVSAGLVLESVGLMGLAIRMGTFVLFNLLAAAFLIRFGRKVAKGKEHTVCYTTVCCPKFLFTFFASVYWFLRMLVCHGTLPHRAFHREKALRQGTDAS